MDRILSLFKEPVLAVQIGASSGSEVTWLASRHPRHLFIGTDIYEDVVSYQMENHSAPNLRFAVCSAQNVARFIEEFRDAKPVILGFSGVLQYVHPQHVQDIFRSLAGTPGVTMILFEPASDLNGPPDELDGSQPRTAFSYTHNYAQYADKAGLRTEIRRIIRPYIPPVDYPGKEHTVRYLWIGRTTSAS